MTVLAADPEGVHGASATYLVQRLLKERGSLPMYRRTLIVPGNATASRNLAVGGQ